MCKRISEIFDEYKMCDWCGNWLLLPDCCDHTFENKWECKKCGFVYKAKLENGVILDFCGKCLQKELSNGKVLLKRVGVWHS